MLLLEAGPPDTADLIHVPAAFSALFRTRYDWDHSTGYEPELNGRRVYLPRGKMLGGSSSINAMIYIRGNRADYDGWRDEDGCDGWGYDDLLPYFVRAEDNEWGANDFHGEGGPLRVIDGRSRNERPASPSTTTSTAPSRRASAGTRRRSATGCAAAPRSPTCTRRCSAPTSPCTRTSRR